jgi:photosystem II stability/assembly factor-like uncharacterized protein
MKKIILLSILTISLFAQNPWQIVTTTTMLETNSSPDDIFFLNENKGWLGGQMGIIYYTENGGDTWTIQRDTSSSQEQINDIFFLNDNNGWACGVDGEVIYTSDGGVSWSTSNNTSTQEDLNAITFIDNNIGYACGNNGVIIKTTNGGSSWIVQVTNNLSNLGDIEFWDANRGFAIINSNANGVLWTNSGGFVWSLASLPIPSGTASSRMYGCDAVLGISQGWIAGYHGLVFKTTNYAQTWTLNANFYGSEFAIARDVDFIDNQNGFVSGYNGDIFRTTDGGTNWDILNAGSNQHMKKLSMVSTQTVYVAGSYLQLRKTTDGGTSWIPIVDWPKVSFRGLGIADSLNISASSHGGDISSSSDAGQSFSFPGNSTNPNTGNAYCVYFQNSNLGFLAGQGAEISKSVDGGNTWNAANVTATDFKSIYAMSFVNSTTGWAGASSGIIYKTIDGGDNWTQIHDVGNDIVYDLYFIDIFTGFAVGSDGNIFKCTDGDTAWTLKASFPDVDFYGLHFADAINAFATGDDGIIASTIDGGDNWTISDTLGFKVGDSLYLPDLRDITFVNPDEGWIVGSYGATFYTSDKGNSWNYIDTQVNTTLYEVELLSPSYGYIAGGNSTILQYDPLSSLRNINSNNIPENALLKSNYPNPFNPGTNIEYHINIPGYIELEIFNVQGKKIKVINKKYQQVGTYNYYWNGKNKDNKLVGSGVYFYQLKIDNEIHVKRMLLIK